MGPYKLIGLPGLPNPNQHKPNVIKYNKKTLTITIIILITVKQSYYNSNPTCRIKPNHNPNLKKGKVFYGQEPPSGKSTTTECGFNYQLVAVMY